MPHPLLKQEKKAAEQTAGTHESMQAYKQGYLINKLTLSAERYGEGVAYISAHSPNCHVLCVWPGDGVAESHWGFRTENISITPTIF